MAKRATTRKAAAASKAESAKPKPVKPKSVKPKSAPAAANASSAKMPPPQTPAAKAKAAKATPPASLVDQELARYRSMRNFGVTAEPKGATNRSAANTPSKGDPQQLLFVIQKHAATRLHYDFRLEWNGVLKSWAVAKGPSFFPGDKRLAVQVEDHPLEYGGFEGIIPQGQYGGGTVMVWDTGTWSPHGDADEGLARGNLKFELRGQKLKGSWALIRMNPRPEDVRAKDKGKANWLLIKEHDQHERAEGDAPIIETYPDSAASGRSLEQIAADHDRVWNSNKGSAMATEEAKPSRRPQPAARAQPPASAPSESFPKFLAPQLAGQVATPPSGDGWAHELKLDGYRIQAHLRGGNATLLTRNGLDWTHRMKQIAARLSRLPVRQAVLDGEVVVLAPDGGTSFADLQAAFQEGKQKQLTYFAFDLLHLDGKNLRGEPLSTRKGLLRSLIAPADEDAALRFSEHLVADGARMFAEACRMGAEGIVSKLLASKHAGGRSTAWLKIKCVRQQEFVVGGFTLPSNGSDGIGALLLGYYAEGKLVHAGRTGTGFTQASGAKLRKQLESLRAAACPFDSIAPEARRDAIWVKPTLVAEVAFATWTADKLVRQASFKGLREDKAATDVKREVPMSLNEAKKPKAAQSAPADKSAPAERSAAATRHQVRLTHPDKQIDAESKLTKQQLADYYSAVAESMLPHIAGRPLSIVRCPQGSTKPCFFQKHVAEGLPAGIRGVMVPDKKGGQAEEYITLSTPEALVGLAQLGVLEIHPWGSKNNDLERPDRIIFDLDPDASIPWRTLANAALDVKARLGKLGLETFLKSTGGMGLHVVAPIRPEHDWVAVKAFCKSFAQTMAADNPSLYLATMSKAARKGKIYVDYLRNERGATAVAPYSPRARAGATVAAPLAWKELDADARPLFAVANFPDWADRLKRDPWARMLSLRQKLVLP